MVSERDLVIVDRLVTLTGPRVKGGWHPVLALRAPKGENAA